jgi:hypothetical protein
VLSLYTESQKTLQAQFDSRKLADRVEQAIVTDQIVPELHQAFIESRDFFLGDSECTRRAHGVAQRR